MRAGDISLWTIIAAGFAATVGQILLLRELWVLFYGNELSTALVLAGWLVWTAFGSAVSARLLGGSPPGEATLAVLLTLQALGLPALVLAARGARRLYGIPAGELVPLGATLLICLSLPILFCPVSGALFGVCWAYRHARSPQRSAGDPLAIYLGEALGAAAGGIVFYFVMMRIASALTIALVVALLLLALSGWLVWRGRQRRSWGIAGRLSWVLTALVVLAVAISSGLLERRSRTWQWGEDLAAVRDTPFHNIAILRQVEQITVFTNGLWLLTEPDPATAESAVHPILLQHPDPEHVLLLGGGLAGQLEEVLRYPSVERVDYVEQDPELIAFSRGFLSPATRASLEDPRVRIQRQDAGSLIQRTAEEYDVILMSVGDPINAQMNRFYTEEMFGHVARRLRSGGLFTFAVPGGGDMIGPTHARLLASIDRTLRQVFPRVQAVPGSRARFLAAVEPDGLLLEPSILADRLRERGLQLVHVREDTLKDLFDPFRLDYVGAVLAENTDTRINRQFAPICYLYGMMNWAAQWHPRLGQGIARATATTPRSVVVGIAVMGTLITLAFWLGRPRYRLAVGLSVLVQGGVGMVLQVVLILAFQIVVGFAYLQLALIIAFFMAGLAVGTWAADFLRERRRRASSAIKWLTVLQVAVTVFPLALLGGLYLTGQGWFNDLPSAAVSWVFTTVSFVAGALGGSHFSLAVLASVATGARVKPIGGYLYAVDLAGAAIGALGAGMFVLPLYGISSSLTLLSLLSGCCLLAMLRRPATT